MTERCIFSLICLVLLLDAIICYPVGPVRLPRNEVQYSNGTVVGSYSFKDNKGNPIAVKYFADKTGYGVEMNSFKSFKLDNSTTARDELQNLKPFDDFIRPMKPLLDLAAEIMTFNQKLNKNEPHTETTTKLPDKTNKLDHVSKVTKLSTPDYEKFYQNEVKAPKQCERDRVRVYLAKEKRKKKDVGGN